jgi:hypothetical protein
MRSDVQADEWEWRNGSYILRVSPQNKSRETYALGVA